MKILIKLVILTLIIQSCSQTKTVSTHEKYEKRCNSILKNSYSTIIEDTFTSVINNDTIYLNEVKYECVFTPFYIQKCMFDEFGKWDKIITLKEQRQTMLIWGNVKLFPNDTTEFKVVASGFESYKTTYTSVLVFDKMNNDLLSKNSIYKTRLINYFSKMIQLNNWKKDDFYEVYWKAVDPKHWEKIKGFNHQK